MVAALAAAAAAAVIKGLVRVIGAQQTTLGTSGDWLRRESCGTSLYDNGRKLNECAWPLQRIVSVAVIV